MLNAKKRGQSQSLSRLHQDTFTHARLTRMRVAMNARDLRVAVAHPMYPTQRRGISAHRSAEQKVWILSSA